MEQSQSKKLRVCVTGAAGNVAYALIPLLANGLVFGSDTKIELRLLDIDKTEKVLKGFIMEIKDCCYERLVSVEMGFDANEMFKDADVVIFLGGSPRKKGMERKDLLKENGKIFKAQGEALNKVAKKTVRSLVVANPTNSNCLILQQNAPDIPIQNFSCLNRIDYNRALANLADKYKLDKNYIERVVVWGNHSTKLYPDLSFAQYKDKSLRWHIDDDKYLNGEFLEEVRNRGAEVIEYRGGSSVLSAAHAVRDHLHDWYHGSEWSIFGAYTDGKSYDIPEGLFFAQPVKCKNFEYEVIKDLKLEDATKERIKENADELVEERNEALEYLN